MFLFLDITMRLVVGYPHVAPCKAQRVVNVAKLRKSAVKVRSLSQPIQLILVKVTRQFEVGSPISSPNLAACLLG